VYLIVVNSLMKVACRRFSIAHSTTIAHFPFAFRAFFFKALIIRPAPPGTSPLFVHSFQNKSCICHSYEKGMGYPLARHKKGTILPLFLCMKILLNAKNLHRSFAASRFARYRHAGRSFVQSLAGTGMALRDNDFVLETARRDDQQKRSHCKKRQRVRPQMNDPRAAQN